MTDKERNQLQLLQQRLTELDDRLLIVENRTEATQKCQTQQRVEMQKLGDSLKAQKLASKQDSKKE